MPSPSLPTAPAPHYDPKSVRDWLDARTEPSIRARGWTPERDLHNDYCLWAKAEELDRKTILNADQFEDALDTEHSMERTRRLVQRGSVTGYELCRSLKLLAPIQAAA